MRSLPASLRYYFCRSDRITDGWFELYELQRGIRFIERSLRRRSWLWYRHLGECEFSRGSMALGQLGWIAEMD